MPFLVKSLKINKRITIELFARFNLEGLYDQELLEISLSDTGCILGYA